MQALCRLRTQKLFEKVRKASNSQCSGSQFWASQILIRNYSYLFNYFVRIRILLQFCDLLKHARLTTLFLGVEAFVLARFLNTVT